MMVSIFNIVRIDNVEGLSYMIKHEQGGCLVNISWCASIVSLLVCIATSVWLWNISQTRSIVTSVLSSYSVGIFFGETSAMSSGMNGAAAGTGTAVLTLQPL